MNDLETRINNLSTSATNLETTQTQQSTRIENFLGGIVAAEGKLDTITPTVTELQTKVVTLTSTLNIEIPRLQGLADRIVSIDAFFTDFFTRKEDVATKSKHEMTVDSFKEMSDLLKAVGGERNEISNFNIFLVGNGTPSNKGFKKEVEEWFKKVDDEDTQLFNEHKEAFDTMYKKIEGLVEGATTLGLAKSFKEQKEKYFWGNILFSTVLFATVIFMIGYSVKHYHQPKDWEDAFKFLVSYLPVYGGCIWLATIAGRKLNQHVRLRQEYAFKETLAKAYEGHLREIQRLPEDENRSILLRNHLEIMIYSSAFNPSSTLDDQSHNERQPFFVELISKILPTYFKPKE